MARLSRCHPNTNRAKRLPPPPAWRFSSSTTRQGPPIETNPDAIDLTKVAYSCPVNLTQTIAMPTKSVINPAKSAPAVGPYNHAIRVGDLLFCAGQIPLDPATGNLV